MAALHHPTDTDTLDLDQLEAKLDRIERELHDATAEYFRESTEDYHAHLTRVFAPYTGDPDEIPDPCPACGDTRVFEDDDGFVTDCKVCHIDNPEPWIVPCRSDGTPY